MLNKMKMEIVKYKDSLLKIKVNNVRNKTEYLEGCICEVYERIFIVNCSDGLKRSFSYVDILTGNVEIECKIY